MSQSKYSFMKSAFHGSINEALLHHFPFFDTPRESDYSMMADSIENWMKDNVNSHDLDKLKVIAPELLRSMKDLGLFGLIIPEAFGGSEFTQTLYTRTVSMLNAHDASVALTAAAHQSIGLKGLLLFGTPEQKAKYLPKLASGETIASFALTEPTAGSDAAGIRCRAVKEGNSYVINGSKLWITNGGIADFFTVFAKETINGEDKITAFMVTRDMGGVTHGAEEQKLGLRASSTVEVHFENVRVPAENILGQPGDGFKIAMAILNQGRLGLAGSSIGLMRVLIDQSVAYAKARKAFNTSISEFGLVQNMLTQMAENLYTSESMTYLTTHLVDVGEYDYSIEAAICKVFATEKAWSTVNIAMQLHGGNGYMQDYGIEQKLRDGRIGLIFEGTNEILRLFIAMTGLKEPASEYRRVGKEVSSLQNPGSLESLNAAIGKIGIISEFAFGQLKQSVLTETLKGFHPALEREAGRLAASTKTLATSAGKLIRQYAQKLPDQQLQLARLADIAMETYCTAAVLSRINSVLEKKGGPEKNAEELTLAKLIIRNSRARVHQLSYDIGKNRDNETSEVAKSLLKAESYSFSLKM